MPVAVVTDSTAYLPDDLLQRHDVTVVPLQVVIDGASHDDGRVEPARVADALRRRLPVTTSRPAPHTMLEVYEKRAADGATAVVSVHLSSEMSATHQSAVLAARDSPVPVTVVDSRSLGMSLGYAVVTAAERAAAGESADRVAAAARERAARTSVLFYVDTLEHLRRGGRIGAAQAVLGGALAVKPLLHVVDGSVQLLEKVRTASRALGRMETVAVERARVHDGAVDVTVHHLGSPARADEMAARLDADLPGSAEVRVVEVGAVIGAHAGPGMLGVVVSPR